MMARWQFSDLRVVDSSPGCLADHCFEKGHILACVEGGLQADLKDGRSFTLTPAMRYQVGEGGAPHPSHTVKGARRFVVERARLHHARRT